MAATSEVVEFSLPLPRALDTRIFAHLTLRERSVTVFLTTAAADEQSVPPTMGSFVYALPDKFNPNQPISTPLYTQESNLEFATRIAKLLAKKTMLPAYVGSSLDLSSMGMGGTAEEEMEAFRKVIEVILERVRHITKDANANSSSGGYLQIRQALMGEDMAMTDTAFAAYDLAVPRGVAQSAKWQVDEAGTREARIRSFL